MIIKTLRRCTKGEFNFCQWITGKRVFQSYFALFRVQRADSILIIYRTRFTEFGGELGDQQGLTLERNDMISWAHLAKE